MSYTNGLDKPEDYFNTVTYTGDGSASRDITGVGFQPDFTWIKQRSDVFSHVLGNSVSGDNKFLSSNSTAVEGTDSSKFRTFVSDGFQVGSHPGVNGNTDTYVGWSWLGGGTASSNTDGSITSSVSANTTSGFSIVSYTGNGSDGATVGHGLNSTPQFSIIKNRDGSTDWDVSFDGISGGTSLNLNSTSGVFSPTQGYHQIGTTTLTLKNGGSGIARVNTNTENYIAYCFHSVKGFSKFGSYKGNGNADGTFVYTGFRPSFVLLKRIDNSSYNWYLYDNKRSPFNLTQNILRPDISNAEFTSSVSVLDMLSNGFKLREVSGATNQGTFIYMAFAENPFVTSTGIPTTAR